MGKDMLSATLLVLLIQIRSLCSSDVTTNFRGLKPMASAEREAITGVWGQSPQRGPGAEPLVRGAKPPEAESFFVDVRP